MNLEDISTLDVNVQHCLRTIDKVYTHKNIYGDIYISVYLLSIYLSIFCTEKEKREGDTILEY